MSGVFISYRRKDSGDKANDLSNHISMRFGRDMVFYDFDDIKGGEDFLKKIRAELLASEVVLVLIGKRWVETVEGRRRLEEEDDVLRMEVEIALQSDKVVIPLLVGGAPMPGEDDLPASLAAFSKRNALVLTDEHWGADVGALMTRLQELIQPTRGQSSLREAQTELHQQQMSYFKVLDHGAAADALDLAQQTSRRMDQILPLYPHDNYLQVTRGYLYKNEAMALIRLGRQEEADQALDAGEVVFKTIIVERPEDAGAWNGLGSVEGVRGNYKEALKHVDKALEIDPTYEAALNDRTEIMKRV